MYLFGRRQRQTRRKVGADMTKQFFIRTLFLLTVSGSAFAQRDSMTANIRGGGGDGGKCTIEVDVDGVADVEVRGDRAYIRTLQGQPAFFRRFECNMVMPRVPSDFRFRGIDGRGRVELVRSPDSGGVAVVRIEDSKGGREGYTFDLEWRGGSGTSRDVYRDDRRFPDTYGNRDDRRYSRDSDDGYVSREALGLCQDAVRSEARSRFGVRNVRFRSTDTRDLRGARDRVVGEFEANRGELYEYSCTVNTANGRVRNVDIRRR